MLQHLLYVQTQHTTKMRIVLEKLKMKISDKDASNLFIDLCPTMLFVYWAHDNSMSLIY